MSIYREEEGEARNSSFRLLNVNGGSNFYSQILDHKYSKFEYSINRNFDFSSLI